MAALNENYSTATLGPWLPGGRGQLDALGLTSSQPVTCVVPTLQSYCWESPSSQPASPPGLFREAAPVPVLTTIPHPVRRAGQGPGSKASSCPHRFLSGRGPGYGDKGQQLTPGLGSKAIGSHRGPGRPHGQPRPRERPWSAPGPGGWEAGLVYPQKSWPLAPGSVGACGKWQPQPPRPLSLIHI